MPHRLPRLRLRRAVRPAALALLLAGGAACGGVRRPAAAPLTAASDPPAVRVFRAPSHVVGAYTAVDTVYARVYDDGPGPAWAEPVLAERAAALGANAIVMLDSTRGPDGREVMWDADARRRRQARALAIRLPDPWAGAAALCDSLRTQRASVRAAACAAAVQRDPADTASLRRLGDVRLRQDRTWEAEHLYRTLVQRRPTDAGAHARLGCTLRGADALAASERALALDPGNLLARYRAAEVLALELERPGDALPHVDAVLRHAPDPRAHLLRARILARLGQDEAALEAYRAAAAAGYRERTAWGGMATALARLGRDAEAVAIWTAVLERHRSHFAADRRDPLAPPDERAQYERALRAAGPQPPAPLTPTPPQGFPAWLACWGEDVAEA